MANDAEQEFLRHAEACMSNLLSKLDCLDPDEMEADLSGGVLRLSFPDGRNCILNRQSAAHQIWLAEGASAWHFVRDAAADDWLDTKGRGNLRAILGAILTRRMRRPIQL
jgi:CyaY protein